MIRAFVFLAFLLSAVVPVAAAEKAIHHDLEIVLYPGKGSISVRDTVTLHRSGPVKFTLAPNMVLMEMRVDGRSASPMARNSEFFVALPPSGDQHTLTLVYTGRLSSLDAHLKNPRKVLSFTGAQGTFLPGYAGWYPHFDGPWVTYKASIKTPALHRAILPGKLLSEETQNGIYHAVFETESALDDIDLFAGPYTVSERMVDGTRVRTYFHRSLSGHEKGYIDSTAGYLKKFSETVGKYPYSAFHIISSPLPVGYGFPYLTYMGENVLRLPFIRYTSLGHEVLHSWWGNGVYIDYEKGNWAEGLTTYMADYAFETARGGGKALEKRLGWLRDYAALPKGRDRAISSFTSKSHTASQVIGYNKVAYLFHMLKIEIGEEAFDRAIKRFWRDNKGKKAGWPAVEQAFARESKRDLGWFFDQWLNQVGAPKLTLKSVQYSAGKTTIRLVQIPSDYRLSVPVRLSGEGWSQTELVTLSEAEASFSFTTEKKPNTVAIDPGFDIFRRLDAAEAPAILRDVTLSDLVKVVILGDDKVFISAGNQLARRMLDARAQSFSATDSPDEDDVLLIIGHPSAVSNYLEKHFQTGRPSEIASTGTARAWAEKPPGRKAIAVVEADDHAALKALLRPLPHYGRKGYVVFNGAKATVKGMWQPKRSPLIKTLN